MSNSTSMLVALAMACSFSTAQAQVNAGDSVMNHAKGNRLSLSGCGEVAYSRNFHSDNQYRYRRPKLYANDPSNGRFDIPHAVIYLGYDFGKGWTMGTEIEFEHTGTGAAVEMEADEGGEYETEIEKGGEVELEQFWIQKSFAKWANIKLGHIVVPVGLNNAHHEPLNFFTVSPRRRKHHPAKHMARHGYQLLGSHKAFQIRVPSGCWPQCFAVRARQLGA